MSLRSSSGAALAAGILLLLAACGAARPIKYYSLDPPEITQSAQPLDVALLIGHVHAPTLYRDTRIVYRTGANEMGVYEEHRWVEAPPLMAEEMLLECLRKSARYKSVQLVSSNAQGDYIVRGRLERFEQVEGKPLSARVWLNLGLYDPKSGQEVWTQAYQHDEEASGSDLNAVVAALDKNIQQGIVELSAGIDRYLTTHPRPPAATTAK